MKESVNCEMTNNMYSEKYLLPYFQKKKENKRRNDLIIQEIIQCFLRVAL